MTTTEDILEHHLEAFESQDLEAVMEDYTDESTIVTNIGTFRGREEIEGLFSDLLDEFDDPETSVTLENQVIEDEFAYITWYAETPENEYEFATDTFHIPDDVIAFQTFAGKIEPKD